MKILYLTKGDHVDYQNDCLLIGLKELFGSDVVDHNKQLHNYIAFDKDAASRLYGKGFSVTRVLPDDTADRSDITAKIKNKFYDFIVYGSIWRFSDYITDILKYYPPNKVIAVDGEDETNIHPVYNLGVLYFKRELIYDHARLYPISFAIPTDKIKYCTTKTRDFSICDPRDRSTYIYKNEEGYYKGYQEARYGVTTKKAGWDCMRHYEIMANGCLPYFIGIDKCPDLTMVSFPKDLCKKLLAGSKYDELQEDFYNHLIQHNTTQSMAKSFVNKIHNTLN